MVDVGRLRAILDRLGVETVHLRRLADTDDELYVDIDDCRVVAISREGVTDLERFRRSVAALA